MAILTDLALLIPALELLRPNSLERVINLVDELLVEEGHESIKGSFTTCVNKPQDGVGAWVSNLELTGASPNTVRVYKSAVLSFLSAYPVPTRDNVREWLHNRRQLVSAHTACLHLKAIKSLFGYLVTEGLWPVNPTIGVKGVKVQHTTPPIPTLTEVKLIMNYTCRTKEATTRFRDLTQLMLSTGLRISEAVNIKPSDIDTRACTLRVVGKGNKLRHVPLRGEVLLVLTQRVFNNNLFNITANAYERTFKRACLAAGLPDYTPHSLRHLFVTRMLQNGATVKTVASIVGHSSTSTTENVYHHVTAQDMASEIMRFAPQ